MIWPIFWILFLLGIVVTFLVIGAREKAARKKAAPPPAAPMPLDDANPASGNEFGDDGFGASDNFGFDNTALK